MYRCIDMHLRLFNWEKALEIAVTNKTHVDTVLLARQRYLKQVGVAIFCYCKIGPQLRVPLFYVPSHSVLASYRRTFLFFS